MTIKKVSLVALVVALGGLAFFPLKAALGPEEKQDIQKIVHEYLIENPEVIKEALQALQKKEIEAQKQQAINTIESRHDEIFGASSPAVAPDGHTITLVEFFDYQCRYCKKMEPTVKQIQEANKDVRVVYKELPVLGNNSMLASKAALAAQMQGKYIDLHKKFMMHDGKLDQLKILSFAEDVGLDVEQLKKDMESPEVLKQLQDNMTLARDIGIRGTPAFILGPSTKGSDKKPHFMPGAVRVDQLQKLIDETRG